jgi:hypothetical protein
MKKTTISVAFDEEKLSAAKLYMEQKGLSFETEMERAADALYGKYVPANVREFIEMSAGTKAVPKLKKPKPSPSSAVGAEIKSEVNADERH